MKNTDHLPPLTSLRFLAAAMIVALHSTNYFPEAKFLTGLQLQQGVSFFFVLSGFILAHSYGGRPFDSWTFLISRFARLWPLHVATLAAVLLFIRTDSRQLHGTGFFDPWLVMASNVTLTHALVPYLNYTFSWNSVSWSISTEFFFYLSFPFLVRGIRRNWPAKLTATAGLIVGYALAARLLAIPPVSTEPTDLTINFLVYASPLFRGFEFVLGMAVHVVWSKNRASGRPSPRVATLVELAVLALVLAWTVVGYGPAEALFRLDPTLAIWRANAGSTFIVAIVIFVFASGHGVVGRVLSLPLFVWLGEVSFALYMCHQIIMKWFFLQHLENKMALAPLWVVLAACMVAAALLHHLVERPANSGIRSLGARLLSRRVAKPASDEATSRPT